MEWADPVDDASAQAERILRSLPRWFGIESSLLQYVEDTKRFPTFVAREKDLTIGFLSVRQHFPEAWEIHCMAIDAAFRRRGIGRALHERVERWLVTRGARYLQVKTIAEVNAEYDQTRAFYSAMGYAKMEIFPQLRDWDTAVLQLIKALR